MHVNRFLVDLLHPPLTLSHLSHSYDYLLDRFGEGPGHPGLASSGSDGATRSAFAPGGE